jgi:hypothetical protein
MTEAFDYALKRGEKEPSLMRTIQDKLKSIDLDKRHKNQEDVKRREKEEK